MKLKTMLLPVPENKGLKSFFLLFLPFLITGLVLIILLEKGDILLLINKYSREEWDGFIDLLTDLGLGGVIAGIMIIMGFFRTRYAVMGLFNLGLVGVFTFLLKRIFYDQVRPLTYFHEADFYRFIQGNEMNYLHSFPSGHTMAIFAAMSLLSYFSGRKITGFFLFFIALIIGMTRVYLCQHFFIDVYFGSIFGVTATLITIWIGDHWLVLNQREAFQSPVCKLIKKSLVVSHKS